MDFVMNPILIQHLSCRPAKTPQLRFSLMTLGTCLLIAAGCFSSCDTLQGVAQDLEVSDAP
jgi:hypothetical protein